MSIPEFKTPTPAETDAILRDARALRAEFISNAVKRLVVFINRSNEFRFPMGKPSAPSAILRRFASVIGCRRRR